MEVKDALDLMHRLFVGRYEQCGIAAQAHEQHSQTSYCNRSIHNSKAAWRTRYVEVYTAKIP
jgi:hypothetical protein